MKNKFSWTTIILLLAVLIFALNRVPTIKEDPQFLPVVFKHTPSPPPLSSEDHSKDDEEPYIVESIYGEIEIEEEVLMDLINSKAMQRLKGIHQYGVLSYMERTEDFSRYDHSLGVLHLLRRQGRPLHEQIAGLLYNVSHTAFSHLGDFFFAQKDSDISYQDSIHGWYLEKSDICEILKNHGITIPQVLYKNPKFHSLKQKQPYVSADRFDYNLQGAYRRGFLTKKEMMKIFYDLKFDGKYWSLSDVHLAEKLATFSLHMTEFSWNSIENYLGNKWLSEAISEAISLQELPLSAVSFGGDKRIWEALQASRNPLIRDRMMRIQNVYKFFSVSSEEQANLHIPMEFEGINPALRTENGLRPLSKLRKSFASNYLHIRSLAKRGWNVIASLQNSEENNNHNLTTLSAEISDESKMAMGLTTESQAQ